jgi:hypothetical protein
MTPVFAHSGRGLAGSDFAKGDFFIVSLIDLAKNQILLKRPAEVTELMRVEGETRYFEEGKRKTDAIGGPSRRGYGPHYVETHGRTIGRGRDSQRPHDVGWLREGYLKSTK